MKLVNMSMLFFLFNLACIALTQSVMAGLYFDNSIMSSYSIPDSQSGTTWYVDGVGGNDSNDGLSFETAFKTLTRSVNKYKKLTCGDTIKIASGVYFERILIDKKFNCTATNPITIGPYGNGRVVIDATDTDKINWEINDSNVFKFNFTNLEIGAQDPRPQAIIMDDDYLRFRSVQTLAEVNSYGKWFWDPNDNYVYVYTGGDVPIDHDVVVVPFDKNNNRYVIKGALGASGINLMGLTIQGGTGQNIWIQGDEWKIEQCIVRYSLKGAIYGKGETLSGIGFRDQDISKNNIYGNVLLNWPRGTTWAHGGGWPPALTLGNYTHAHGNIVHDNGGEGIIVSQREGFDIIEDNIVYDNWSVGIYCGSSAGHIVRRNLIYVSRFNLSDLMDTNLIPLWSSREKLAIKLRQEGITIGEEYAATKTSRADGTLIYNNLIVHCRIGFNYIGERGVLGDEKMQNHKFINNTIILPETYDEVYDRSFGLNLRFWGGKNINNVIKNNIIYGENPFVNVLKWDIPSDPGIDVNNNLYFTPNNSTPFLINPSGQSAYEKVNFENYVQQGADSSTVIADPQFVAVGNKLKDPGYYSLKNSSPAVDKALAFSANFNDDFFGVNRGINWDIGALERAVPKPVIQGMTIK